VTTLGQDLLALLNRVGVSFDVHQAAALGAGLGELVARQAGIARTAGEDCCICGCPLADLACGHSCCCMAAPPPWRAR